MCTGCAPWRPALAFFGDYGIWVGLVLVALLGLTFLARKDQQLYEEHMQHEEQLEEARRSFRLLKAASELEPEDLGYQGREPGEPVSQDRRPYFETYIPRLAVRYEQRTEEDPQPQCDEDTLSRSLKDGRGFVLLGPPLDGKSRTLYEVLKG